MVVKEPIGVQLAIAPWNASLFLAMRSVATPIACGNPAVLKASEISPAVHNFIGTLFAEAGFPPGVLNVIQHRREDAAAILDVLISDDRIRKVNFTGSTTVGKIVAAKAAQNCKPVLLELGGKSPQIVLKDADLDKAAQAAALGAFSHVSNLISYTYRRDEENLNLPKTISTAKFACQLSVSLWTRASWTLLEQRCLP